MAPHRRLHRDNLVRKYDRDEINHVPKRGSFSVCLHLWSRI
nr:uncharacterized protein CTRU02_05214 [Colletotrichum truncatum]KAF6794382.1 hypothetical protein CTRU02_05214 [Colletotrichum truncatum]